VTAAGSGAVYGAMRLALLLVLTLSLTACGSGSSPSALPKGPPPSGERGDSPPAWIETRAGTRWLGYSSYCWNHPEGNAMAHLCADFVAPKCSQRSVPSLLRAKDADASYVGCGVIP
jgi:hypothetical protein